MYFNKLPIVSMQRLNSLYATSPSMECNNIASDPNAEDWCNELI